MFSRFCLTLLLFFTGIAAISQAQSPPRKFALAKFDNSGCQAKGRAQDCSGKVMSQILAGGKASIPVLISQLTDTGHTKEPIEDYWAETSSGDIAFIVLTDLFTDEDSNTLNMPGVPGWALISADCHSNSETCWREYLKKHGRKSVQEAWLQAWNKYKDQIYWNPNAQCFMIAKK